MEYENEDKRVLETIEDRSRFLFGLYSNGESLLKLIYTNDGVEFYHLNDHFEGHKIYQTEFAESVTYRKNWISFLGKQRTEERERLQYYLIDDEGKIDYPYEDGSIFMSNAGILWVDFKKAEKEIQKGEVFTNENSVLRFFAFDEE